MPVITKPDFNGGSIVNLMSSIGGAMGAPVSPYPRCALLDPSQLTDRRRLVLIVIDGLGYHYLTDAGRGSVLHRHLVGHLTSVYPPTTATAIPTFLTGHPPQQHGFTGWFTYFRELGALLTVLPFRPRCGGSPLGQTGLSPLALSGVPPIFDGMQGDCFVVAPAHIASSDFNRAFCGSADVRPYQTLGEFFDSVRDALETASAPGYVYAYWPEFDRLAHEFGVASAEVQRHFRELDRAFARFLREIAGSRATLLVTADHGFVDTAPEFLIRLDDHPELAETLALPLCGEPRTAFCYVRSGFEGRFESYVQSHLRHAAHLIPSAALVSDGVFGQGPAYPPLADRIGDYTLVMKGRYVFKDWILGERPYRHIGVHGGATEDELFVPLIRVDC